MQYSGLLCTFCYLSSVNLQLNIQSFDRVYYFVATQYVRIFFSQSSCFVTTFSQSLAVSSFTLLTSARSVIFHPSFFTAYLRLLNSFVFFLLSFPLVFLLIVPPTKFVRDIREFSSGLFVFCQERRHTNFSATRIRHCFLYLG